MLTWKQMKDSYKELLNIDTHWDLYWFDRLLFGVKCVCAGYTSTT